MCLFIKNVLLSFWFYFPSLWWFLVILFVRVWQSLFLLSGFDFFLLCGFGAPPWLCSIDPCIAVLCHGWHRGVALCWCGETSLPWFISFSLPLSFSPLLSFLLVFLWYHISSIHHTYIHVFPFTSQPSVHSNPMYFHQSLTYNALLWVWTYICKW